MAEQDVNLMKPVNGHGIQVMKQNNDKTYAKKVNNVGIDPATGNITLGSNNIPYGTDSNVQAEIDAIKDKINYVPIVITSFSNNVNTVEKGTKVRAVDVTWSFNNAVLQGATLNGTALTADELKAKKKSFAYPEPTGDAADPALVKDTVFTLVATDTHKATATKTTGVYFKNQKYWGVGAVGADAIDSAFILSLTGKAFADNFKGSWDVTADEGKYIYFAFPTAWGTPKFSIGGFEGGFAKVKTLDFTNASGYTESYDVYQSATANLGATTVVVG